MTDARAEIERMARRLERPDRAVIGTDIPVRSVAGSLVVIVGVSEPAQAARG